MNELVDFVVNVYERTYRKVLAPGWFKTTQAPLRFPFARTVVLINNTDDPNDARRRSEALLSSGEIDEAHFVSDQIDASLQTLGLRQKHLGAVPHFSDCAFVALTVSGSPWLLYWDADLVQVAGGNWITPALHLLQHDPAVAVASPAWHPELPQQEATRVTSDFAIGYGFSDLAFLCHRETFIGQNWTKPSVPASYRYPLAPVTPVFEQRVDSWMRRNRQMRATYLHARVEHRASEGDNYPQSWPLTVRTKSRIQRRLLQATCRLAPSDPRFNPHPRSSTTLT